MPHVRDSALTVILAQSALVTPLRTRYRQQQYVRQSLEPVGMIHVARCQNLLLSSAKYIRNANRHLGFHWFQAMGAATDVGRLWST